MLYHGIIFTGQTKSWRTYLKTIGAYRIRTLCAQHGYNIKIVDHAHLLDADKMEQICDFLISNETFFIGGSKTFLTDPEDMKAMEVAFSRIKKKYPKMKFVLGGAGTYKSKIENPPWDIQMVGFSDISFIDVLEYLSGKKNTLQHQLMFNGQMNVVYSKNYSTDFDMDNIGTVWLPEDDIKPTDALPIEISRGCIFKCDFCSYELNGKKKFDYFKTIDSLVSEIQYNKEQFGVSNYVFLDDTYNDSREKLNLIDEVLSQLDFDITFETFIRPELLVAFPETVEQLKQQGLISCTMGIESLHGKTRQAISKKKDYWAIEEKVLELKNEKNIGVQYTMIAGLPHEEVSSMKESFKHLQELDAVDDHAWQPLVMTDGSSDFASKIEKDPIKYGYKVFDKKDLKDSDLQEQMLTHLGRRDDTVLYWESEQTNFLEVLELSQEFMMEHRKTQRLAGIGSVGQARCAGVEVDTDNGLKKILTNDLRKLEDDPAFWNRANDYFENLNR